jgi:hypothetical protein
MSHKTFRYYYWYLLIMVYYNRINQLNYGIYDYSICYFLPVNDKV